MHSNARTILENKKILILGFGKEGQSTYRLLREWFPENYIGIADANRDVVANVSDSNTAFYLGEDYMNACPGHDLVIKSPGISYEKVAECCPTDNITSQTDLFLQAYASQVIGVTGTKGKSTVVSLIHHIFESSGHNAVLAGNIGIPPLSLISARPLGSLVNNHRLETLFPLSSLPPLKKGVSAAIVPFPAVFFPLLEECHRHSHAGIAAKEGNISSPRAFSFPQDTLINRRIIVN